MQMAKRDLISMEILSSIIQSPHYFKQGLTINPDAVIDETVTLADKLIQQLFNPKDGFKLVKMDGSTIPVDPILRSTCATKISEGTYGEACTLLQDTVKCTEQEAEAFLNLYCN